MDPFAVVEAQLGSEDSCPPYVLRLMFSARAQFTGNEEASSVYVREKRKSKSPVIKLVMVVIRAVLKLC